MRNVLRGVSPRVGDRSGWSLQATGGKLRQPPPSTGRPHRMEPRFMLMSDVAEQLNVSMSQVYHMVRSGELPAIKIGGRGQWRIERSKLEEYIERLYADTKAFIAAHPWTGSVDDDPDAPDGV